MIDIYADDFIQLVRSKLSVPKTGKVTLESRKLEYLGSTLIEELNPTLIQDGLEQFDLYEVVSKLQAFVEKMQNPL